MLNKPNNKKPNLKIDNYYKIIKNWDKNKATIALKILNMNNMKIHLLMRHGLQNLIKYILRCKITDTIPKSQTNSAVDKYMKFNKCLLLQHYKDPLSQNMKTSNLSKTIIKIMFRSTKFWKSGCSLEVEIALSAIDRNSVKISKN